MKRVNKGSPPQELIDFVSDNPTATWDEMCNHAFGGMDAARECREQAMRDQGGLCAYCEIAISSDKLRNRRIEHFHPKSDTPNSHNWSLDWMNMFAVCDGGSATLSKDRITHPLPENLSCDAHKDRMIQSGYIPVNCKGYLLNPPDIPPLPNLFELDKGTGYFKPYLAGCEIVEIPDNELTTTAELVNNTISGLNLNCERLAEKRRRIVVDVDRNKKRLRDKGISFIDAPKKLSERYFSKKWPEFFTTLRCCLGAASEDYLTSINYKG